MDNSKYRNMISQKRFLIESEIKVLSIQLENVEKRFSHLTFTLKVHAAILAFHYITIFICAILSGISEVSAYYTNIIMYALSILGIVIIPTCVFVTMNHSLLLRDNKDINNITNDIEFPKERPPYPFPVPREKNMAVEKMKILWVLNKYYLFTEKLDAYKEQLDKGTFEMDEKEFKKELDKLVLYQDIKPAPSFDNDRIKGKKFIIIFMTVTFFLFAIMFLLPLAVAAFRAVIEIYSFHIS